MTAPASPEAVLEFWFGRVRDGFADEAHRQIWFAPDAELDAVIAERFGATLQAAERGELNAWRSADANTCLAFIITTDQFSRNVHRGHRQAFATDALALHTAQAGVRSGLDRALGFDERAFFYLPFEHSEDLVDQHTSVGLFTQLRDETPPGFRHLTGNYLRHAHQHRDVIARFGRFPARNSALERTDTEAEAAYLGT